MKVFVSWSGGLARSVARVLHNWLPTVVQHVEPWMSDEDVDSGGRWGDQLAGALEQSDYGIVCVTAANQHNPWLMFEAGALAKSLSIARVIPLCIDVPPARVTGPLSAFQGRSFDRDGIHRIVLDLGAKRDVPLSPDVIEMLFDAMWPQLDSAVAEAKNAIPETTKPARSVEDMLDEVVERLRRIERAGLDWRGSDPPNLLTLSAGEHRSLSIAMEAVREAWAQSVTEDYVRNLEKEVRRLSAEFYQLSASPNVGARIAKKEELDAAKGRLRSVHPNSGLL